MSKKLTIDTRLPTSIEELANLVEVEVEMPTSLEELMEGLRVTRIKPVFSEEEMLLREIRKRSSLDADDSTDDESVTASVTGYKMEEEWDKFKSLSISDNYTKFIDEDDLKYSFILHAFGRGVYYSEPVNAIYESRDGLKDTHLRKQNSSESRKTLSQTEFPIGKESFESEIDYVANRRMTDRSEKRREKNNSGFPRDRSGMPKTQWSFSSANIKETKGVKLVTNTSRDDWTLYKDEEIPYLQKRSGTWVENIATNLSGVPQDDAEQIRAVLRGDQIQGDAEKLEKLAFLTNLFFGSETARSPVGFVSHQMFLDLIGSNRKGFGTWKEAFNNFPQIGEGAINALRFLNDYYNGSMPYNYRYDANRGFEDKRVFKSSPLSPQQQAQKMAKSIISAEAKIAKEWLALKFPKKQQTPETLMEVLPSQIENWYREVDLSHFIPNTTQQTKKIEQEKQFPGKPRDLYPDLKDTVVPAQDIDFNQDHYSFTFSSLIDCYNTCAKDLVSDRGITKSTDEQKDESGRCLTDDERFVCLWLECTNNSELQFNINREEGFAEIKRGEELLAICPIQSISTDHGNYKDTIKNFIETHEEKGVKIIFSIHGDCHYKTLATDTTTKKYRYIDPMHDSKDGVIEEHADLKTALNNLGYSRSGHSYQKQQYSEAISKKNGGVLSHNNECAFHNIYTTIRIAQSRGIGSDLGDMKKYGMKMLKQDRKTLTPEFARDHIRPFYEEVFKNLRKFISDQKRLPSPEVFVSMSRSVFSDKVVKTDELNATKGSKETISRSGEGRF